MSLDSDAIDATVHTAVYHLQREQIPARLSAILAQMAKDGNGQPERTVDRALQRLRKRKVLEFKSKHGWRAVPPATMPTGSADR